jgi:hypothetical protein
VRMARIAEVAMYLDTSASSVSLCLSGRFGSPLRDRLQQIRRAGVVAEGFTHVYEEIFVAGRKDKTAAELQWIFAQAVLFVSGCLSAAARLHVVSPQKVEQGSVAQPDSFISFTLFIDKQREVDAGFFAKELRIAGVPQADRGQLGALLPELLFKRAQLRDVLATENSTVVAQEDKHGRSAFPQGAQACGLAVGIRQCDSGQLTAEGVSHAGHSGPGERGCQAATVDFHIYIYKENSRSRNSEVESSDPASHPIFKSSNSSKRQFFRSSIIHTRILQP